MYKHCQGLLRLSNRQALTLTSAATNSSIHIHPRVFSNVSSTLDNGNCIGDHENPIGFIGLGKIGFAMANNLAKAGYSLLVYDELAIQSSQLSQLQPTQIDIAKNLTEIGSNCQLVISSLPNDQILRQVTHELHDKMKMIGVGEQRSRSIHLSCSTVSPATAREMAHLHCSSAQQSLYVSAPVFARPDGMARAEATIPVSGPAKARHIVIPILENTSTAIYDFGEEVGAANVAKLCGNFCIAAAIESMSESLTLAEKNGVDRTQLMGMLSETIFDCLIYRGYGQRVSEFDHTPYENAHFSLELGHKDVNLMLDTANESQVAMPFLSVLHDRYLTSMSQGNGKLDWSAIALNCAQDAGLGNKNDNKTNK